MILRLTGAAALMLVPAGPALAVGATCSDQIASLRGQLHDSARARAALGAKVEQANQLCKQHKDEEAQDLLRQIRERLSEVGGARGATGSSAPSGTGR